MNPLKKILEEIAELETRYNYTLLILFTLLTAFLLTGVPNIQLQTNLSKALPQDIPAIQQQEKVSRETGRAGTVIVLARLKKENTVQPQIEDIRDPEVIKSLLSLQQKLQKDPKIKEIQSVASVFQQGVPAEIQDVQRILQKAPTAQLFNDDYSATVMIVSAGVPQEQEKIKRFISRMEEDIESVEKPSNLKYSITGEAPSRMDLLGAIKSDTVKTTAIAFILILIFLVIVQRSVGKAAIILTPLVLGLTWTFGLLGILHIPLSIATIAVGGMILGLGVEYGVFMKERYEEETQDKKPEEALKATLPSVGLAILGSGTTTTFAFLSLLLATVPMIRRLGIILGLGIVMCLTAVIFISPTLQLTIERLRGEGE